MGEQPEDGGGNAVALDTDLTEDAAIDEANGEFSVRTGKPGAEATPERGTLLDTDGVLFSLAEAELLLKLGGFLARRTIC